MQRIKWQELQSPDGRWMTVLEIELQSGFMRPLCVKLTSDKRPTRTEKNVYRMQLRRLVAKTLRDISDELIKEANRLEILVAKANNKTN